MSFSDIFHPLAGGLLIGLAALLLLLADGKTAGISGMLGGVVRSPRGSGWRLSFLLGLFASGALFHATGVVVFAPLAERSSAALMLAGLLVGLGTQLGSGCTSGHGVCGVGRGSARSIAATLTFMAAGALTVFLVRTFAGGAL